MITNEIPLAWYENYFDRAFTKICKDMGECEGFFSWLAEYEPVLYLRLEEAWDLISTLWLSRAEQQSFKDACKSWYTLLMEAKKGFDAHKMRKLEETRQPAQKAMALG